MSLSLTKVGTYTGDSEFGTTLTSVVVQGNYAYLTNVGGNVQIADITDKNDPVEVGKAVTAFNQGISVNADSTVLYALTNNAFLNIYDISDKTNPTGAGGIQLGDGVSTYASSGSNQTCLVLSATAVVSIIYNISESRFEICTADVTDPNSPTQFSNPILLDSQVSGARIFINGTDLFIAESWNTAYLQIEKYDMSDPSNPSLTATSSHLESAVNLEGFSGNDETLFVMYHSDDDQLHRLVSVASSDLSELQSFTTDIDTTHIVRQIAFSNNMIASVDNNFDSIFVFDVSDPSNMSQLATDSQGGTSVGFSYPYVYVPVDDSGAEDQMFIYLLSTLQGWTYGDNNVIYQ